MTAHELAERFGVSVRTLQDWRRRHGFPPPLNCRHGGPHCRYGQTHVEWIRAWLALKHNSVSGKEAAAHCQEVGISLAQYVDQREASIRDFGIGVA